MRLTGHDTYKFDDFSAFYNWIYPLCGSPDTRFCGQQAAGVFSQIPVPVNRALYFHIPFCETICTFCPFVRGEFRDAGVLDAYVDALIREIDLKARYRNLTCAPIAAIFFGGGTPSLLSPDHIRRIGRAIHERFDLGSLQEFSFEFEAKSVTTERIEALQEVGVTHARFGLQTFSSRYRSLFNLTASLEDIHHAAELLSANFRFTSCDVLYGMNGETEEEILADIDSVCSLGLNNIDLYPINNVVTQPKLHRSFRSLGLQPTSGLTKFYMRLLVRKAMEDRGFLPHNGHGWVKVDPSEIEAAPVITSAYSFIYHEHVLGPQNRDLIGFGTNALSSVGGYTMSNTASRDNYVTSLLKDDFSFSVAVHHPSVDACRAIALTLPYHGVVAQDQIDWESIPTEVVDRLGALEDHRLIDRNESTLRLTRAGWDWYSSIMYYLLPRSERVAIDRLVRSARRDSLRDIELSGISELIEIANGKAAELDS